MGHGGCAGRGGAPSDCNSSAQGTSEERVVFKTNADRHMRPAQRLQARGLMVKYGYPGGIEGKSQVEREAGLIRRLSELLGLVPPPGRVFPTLLLGQGRTPGNVQRVSVRSLLRLGS